MSNFNAVCRDVFIDHWQTALSFINCTFDPTACETIFRHIDIMISIIIKDSEEEGTSLEKILDYCDENFIFHTLFTHFNRDFLPLEVREYGVINQLRVYDNLINFLPSNYLMRDGLMSPVLKLLEECSLRSSVKIEHFSIHLLYQLSVLVTRDSLLLDYVKQISLRDYQEEFYFVSLIIQMIHRDKDIGRLSQEAMLLLLNYTKDEDSDMVDYICFRSDFSAILATVLSGLYSSFPRKLENLADDWQQITRDFIGSVPELRHSLELLDFCNLAVKMSHSKIQNDVLEYLYTGFLSPVIGPSLHQNSLEETISATAYLELFLRHLRQPLLIKLFLHFIMTEKQENYVVLDSLINRLSSVTMDSLEGMYTLGVVTLSLFRTMFSFHCEDVMFNLIFRYLIPCDHLIKQKWSNISFDSSSGEDLASVGSVEKHDNKLQTMSFRGFRINEDLSNSAEHFLKLSFGIYSEEQNLLATINSIKNKFNQAFVEQRRMSLSPIVLGSLNKFQFASPFYSYLQSSALYVNRRILATDSWNFNYDGVNPPMSVFETVGKLNEQYQEKCPFSRKTKESNETIIDYDLNTQENSESPNHNCHDPVKDFGYFSSNNGSGSNISNKHQSSTAAQLIKMETVPSESESSDYKIRKLCQAKSVKSIYKLNYFYFDSQSRAINLSEQKCDDSLSLNNYYDSTNDTDPIPGEAKELFDDNLQTVLFSSHEDCDLTEFCVSLDLLEVGQRVEWNLTWENVDILLKEHHVDIGQKQSFTTIHLIQEEDESSQATQSTPTNEAIFKRRLQSFDQSMYSSPCHPNATVTLGPFLTALLQRLSVLSINGFFMNLLITNIITDLAAYPHPLLKSLFLDVNIILQPHISKLYEILSEVRVNLIEKSCNIPNWETILVSAYEYLYSRINCSSYENINNIPVTEEDYEVRFVGSPQGSVNNSITNFFPRRRSSSSLSPNKVDKKGKRTPFGILTKKKKDIPQYRFPIQRFNYAKKKNISEFEAQRIRNLAYNWVLFDEFCKELASLCQEHTQHCFF